MSNDKALHPLLISNPEVAGFAPFNQDVTNNVLSDRVKYPKIPTSIYGNSFPEGYELAIETIPVKSVVPDLC